LEQDGIVLPHGKPVIDPDPELSGELPP